MTYEPEPESEPEPEPEPVPEPESEYESESESMYYTILTILYNIRCTIHYRILIMANDSLI